MHESLVIPPLPDIFRHAPQEPTSAQVLNIMLELLQPRIRSLSRSAASSQLWACRGTRRTKQERGQVALTLRNPADHCQYSPQKPTRVDNSAVRTRGIRHSVLVHSLL